MKTGEKLPVKLTVSIALLSVSLIAYQLLLIQILSIVQWYHFAYMIISVALLGFGSAGAFLSVFRKQLLDRFDNIFPLVLLATSILMAAAVSISQTEFFYFDSYRLFNDFANIRKIIATYLIFFLPFFSGALGIGMVFTKNVEKIGILYFANMFGSGTGGILAVILMWIFFPEKLSVILSAIVFTAGIISFSGINTVRIIILTVTVIIITSVYINSPALRLSEYKSLSKTLNLPETKITDTESSPYGLLSLVSSSYIRYAPGLSLLYPGMISVNNAAFNNGDWLGPLIHSSDDPTDYFRFSTEHLPYVTSAKKNILVLNSGTGRQLLHALSEQAVSITAVEPDKALLELLSTKYADLVDSVYNNSVIKTENVYPRTYLLSSDLKFDLIQVPTADAFGGTSGIYALQEQYLMTKEAFNDMFSKLNDNGMISLSIWIDYPYKNPLKILATIAETLNERKIENPVSHIAGIKNWNTLTITVKREPFTQDELNKIRVFCRSMKFDPVILSGINEEERDYYNRLQDKSLYSSIDQILESSEKREELYVSYPFNIKPATDDKPYYSQFLRWKGISALSDTFGNQSLPFIEIGYILLYLTFFQILPLAFILIILPLIKTGRKSKDKLKTFFYFSGLGLGYMFIEIILIQRFTLYFGNIIYSAAAVVSLMLIASGLGSLASQKIKNLSDRSAAVLFLIIILLIIYTIILSPLLKTTIAYNLPIKIIFAAILITPVAFLMGMPFPLGLRLIASKGEADEVRLVPWAWGINGIFSVTGTVAAAIIAVELGFFLVMLFAAAAYFITLITCFRWK